eukprot:768535-Hanusia_phi.AAC.2
MRGGGVLGKTRVGLERRHVEEGRKRKEGEMGRERMRGSRGEGRVVTGREEEEERNGMEGEGEGNSATGRHKMMCIKIVRCMFTSKYLEKTKRVCRAEYNITLERIVSETRGERPEKLR